MQKVAIAVFPVSGIASQNAPQKWTFAKQNSIWIPKWCKSILTDPLLNPKQHEIFSSSSHLAARTGPSVTVQPGMLDMGLWTGHGTKEVGDNVAHHDPHVFGAGPVCLLPTTAPLQRWSGWACAKPLPDAVALSSGAVCAASVDSVSRGGAAGWVTLCGSSSHIVCHVCLLSGLTDIGLHHCCLVDGCPESTPTPSHPQHGGVRAACVNAWNGWLQKQLIVTSCNRPSSALHFCTATRLVQIFIHFIITDTLFTTFIFVICVFRVLQLQHYMFYCWCYCYSILLTICVAETADCYRNVDVVNLVLVQLQCEFVQLNLKCIVLKISAVETTDITLFFFTSFIFIMLC